MPPPKGGTQGLKVTVFSLQPRSRVNAAPFSAGSHFRAVCSSERDLRLRYYSIMPPFIFQSWSRVNAVPCSAGSHFSAVRSLERYPRLWYYSIMPPFLLQSGSRVNAVPFSAGSHFSAVTIGDNFGVLRWCGLCNLARKAPQQ